jgi:hypothetical protein
MRLIVLFAISAISLATPNHPFRRWSPVNLQQLFQQNSVNAPTIFGTPPTINKTPPQYWVTPEQFGAYGDNSHNDVTYINNAISALLSSGVCGPTTAPPYLGSCTVAFQAKTYQTNAPITLAGSYVTLIGQGMVTTTISNTAMTGDALDITGTAANCNAGGAFWNRVEKMYFLRVNGNSGSGVGINMTDNCWTKIIDVESDNSYVGMLVNASGDTVIQDTQVTGASNSAYGYESTNQSQSTLYRRAVYNGSNSSNYIGLYIPGCPSDTFVEDFAGAHGAYGIQITGTTESGVSICNGDIHIVTPIIDSAGTVGIQINNLNSGGLAAVDINGGYVSSLGIGVDLENVSGATVRGVQLRNGTGASGTIGLKIAGSGSNADVVAGNVIQQVITCVSVNGSGNHVITGNTCTAVSAQPTTTGFNFVSFTNSTVRNNVMGGSFTNSFIFDSNSNNNTVDGNLGFAYSTVTNSGTGNNFGTLLATPTTTCGTATGNSTSGTISASSSVSTCTITFPVSVTGYTCHWDNWTVPSNLIGQTGGSATTAVMGGTIVSGNTLSYLCAGH